MRERYSSRSRAVATSKKRKNQLILSIALLLLMFVAIISGGIYSYWAGTISDPTQEASNRTVTVGEAENVTTTLNITELLGDKKLVPVGKVPVSVGGAVDNVDSYVDTFQVTWNEPNNSVVAADGVTGTLTVTATPTLTGTNSVDYSSLVNVTIDPSSTSVILNDATAKNVTMTVTLIEPENKTVYDAIINQTITVDLTFDVAQ